MVSLAIWSPLVDVSAGNRNLIAAAGTHRQPLYSRLVNDSDQPYAAFQKVLDQHVQHIPAKAGEAIIFDNALCHGSETNLTDKIRPVASAMAGPGE